MSNVVNIPRGMDVVHPTKKQAKLILDLLDERTKKFPQTRYVVVQEYHPNGGFRKGIETAEVAQRDFGQRDYAPYVLWYAGREYYEKIAADC